MSNHVKINAIEVGDPPYVPFKTIANKKDITMIRDLDADPVYPPHYIVVREHVVEISGEAYAALWNEMVPEQADDTHKKITAVNSVEYVCNMNRLLVTRDIDTNIFMANSQGVEFEISEATWNALKSALT